MGWGGGEPGENIQNIPGGLVGDIFKDLQVIQ